MAEVDVYDSEIPATGIEISGDDYILNNSTTSNTGTYTATTTPGNATGTVTWSISGTDSSGNALATIGTDDTVTPASTSSAGTVTVTATITNEDGTSYSASKDVVIGNGLADQTVDAGSDLTWTGESSATGSGSDDDNDLTYQWYYSATAGSQGTALSGQTSATLNLTDVTTANAGYYTLVVTASGKSVTLGQAKLTVNATETDAASSYATTASDAQVQRLTMLVLPTLIVMWLLNTQARDQVLVRIQIRRRGGFNCNGRRFKCFLSRRGSFDCTVQCFICGSDK
ncbi:hypothetical protein L3X07_13130 [Levilactobacillus brevis]|nr:hypothetical protein [Levilactobacillus brevis]